MLEEGHSSHLVVEVTKKDVFVDTYELDIDDKEKNWDVWNLFTNFEDIQGRS
jgi:hypothetical protein